MPSHDLAGLTKSECSAACGLHGCAIGETSRCSHPCKGGLPIERLNDPAVQAAYDEACTLLGVRNIYTTKETA